jgi:hypothetical protein
MTYLINAVLVFAFIFLGILLMCTVVFGSALLLFGKKEKKRKASPGE